MTCPHCSCAAETTVELETYLRAHEVATLRVIRCSHCDEVILCEDWTYRADPFVADDDRETMIWAFDDMLVHAGVRLTYAVATQQDDVVLATQQHIMNCSSRVYELMKQQGLL